MATPFARIEQRINQAVMTRLANAQAQLSAGGQAFNVVYDAPATAESFDGQVDTLAPTCLGTQAELGALARGDTLLIDARSFAVERSEPDGTGLVRLTLRQAD